MDSLNLQPADTEERAPALPELSPRFAPVGEKERIASIDVLRGFALLGILLMNIVAFAMPFQAYMDPTVIGGATGLNLAVWTFNFIFFDGKMRAIFSMLFGAGLVLMTQRAVAQGKEAGLADIYCRRNLWLLLFGVLHAYVMLWPGDILYPYALTALVLLYPFRHVRPRYLIPVGLLFLAFGPLRSWLEYEESAETKTIATEADRLFAEGKPLTKEQKKAREEWERTKKQAKPDQKVLEEQIDNVRKGYVPIFFKFAGLNVKLQSLKYYVYSFWDVAGMMFLGMALVRLRVFSAGRGAAFYVLMVLLGYGIGLPLNSYVAWDWIESNFDILVMKRDWVFYDAGRLLVCLGHIGVLVLIYKSGRYRQAMTCLAAVGQMALTNYLMQTVMCTLFFYGYGLGYFGALERYQLYFVVAGVWALELIWSPLWLSLFYFGPMEWVWRTFRYWRLQPMLR